MINITIEEPTPDIILAVLRQYFAGRNFKWVASQELIEQSRERQDNDTIYPK